MTWSVAPDHWSMETRWTAANAHPPLNIVISPDSRTIAYNREIEGIHQIFLVTIH